jgi:hypothetical protein
MAKPLTSTKSLRLVHSTTRTTATASEPRPTESFTVTAAQHTPLDYIAVKLFENLLLADTALSSND